MLLLLYIFLVMSSSSFITQYKLLLLLLIIIIIIICSYSLVPTILGLATWILFYHCSLSWANSLNWLHFRSILAYFRPCPLHCTPFPWWAINVCRETFPNKLLACVGHNLIYARAINPPFMILEHESEVCECNMKWIGIIRGEKKTLKLIGASEERNAGKRKT